MQLLFWCGNLTLIHSRSPSLIWDLMSSFSACPRLRLCWVASDYHFWCFAQTDFGCPLAECPTISSVFVRVDVQTVELGDQLGAPCPHLAPLKRWETWIWKKWICGHKSSMLFESLAKRWLQLAWDLTSLIKIQSLGLCLCLIIATMIKYTFPLAYLY